MWTQTRTTREMAKSRRQHTHRKNEEMNWRDGNKQKTRAEVLNGRGEHTNSLWMRRSFEWVCAGAVFMSIQNICAPALLCINWLNKLKRKEEAFIVYINLCESRNLHNIIVSRDELYNDSEQYEHNTGKTYETGTGQSRDVFIQTQWDDNANGNDKHNTKPYLPHCRVPRRHKAYQHFWQCIADNHIVRNHCCVKIK